MQAVVTRVSGFRGTDIAFEYEIRDDLGNVLAFDFHHFKLHAGENAADALALHADYLRRRLAKWALSDTLEKQARRKERRVGARLMDAPWAASLSASPVRIRANQYPVLAMTATEALVLQTVEGQEAFRI